jgi:hypothetical protein
MIALAPARPPLRAIAAPGALCDAPSLRCEGAGAVTVLPGDFERQDYAFALPTRSPLLEPLNRELLAVVGSGEWGRVVERYLGR